MAGVQLYDYQEDALNRMMNGCILNGGVGSGKSRTSLAYYYVLNGGEVNTSKYIPMRPKPKDLYIITTARKRDTLEWEGELTNFRMYTDPDLKRYKHKIVIDSWNNIGKYVDVKDSFFIFDEQRVIGYGAWTKSFLKITVKNQNEWILLSATPGDTWSDYIPVFIANGWYRNKTDFYKKHAVFSRFTKYPKIEKYINEGRLIRLRRHILINMEFKRKTIPHHEYITTVYDRHMYNYIATNRWNIYEDRPIKNAAEFCYVLRKLVNSDPSRLVEVMGILQKHKKAIIFYSYDYELFLLRRLFSEQYRIAERNDNRNDPFPNGEEPWLYLVDDRYLMREWNGHKHEKIPEGERWAYLVEYMAGSEGWNCIETDTIIFYSMNYSYRIMHQASGRIDRLNTPFTHLYYYHLRSNSKIDAAITNAQKRKKKFNERAFAPVFEKQETVNENAKQQTNDSAIKSYSRRDQSYQKKV